MRQIAATLEMSKSTVQRVLKGYQEGHFPGKPGRPRLLQDKEEHELVEFVKKNWKSKQGVSRNDVKEEARAIVLRRFEDRLPSHMPVFSESWLDNLNKRQADEMSLKDPQKLESERFVYMEDLNKFYQLFKSLVDKYHYKPELIVNADQTFICASGKMIKLYAISGKERPTQEMEEKWEHNTLMLGVSSSGDSVKPMIILPLEFMPPLDDKLKAAFHIVGAEKGWITKDGFDLWVKEDFIPYVNQQRTNLKDQQSRALLIVDGHSSCTNPVTGKLLLDNFVDLIVLPAHSSHLLQPLDLSVNKFKCQLAKRWNPEKGVGAEEKRNRLFFCVYYSLQVALVADEVQRGWKMTGLRPFNPLAVKGGRGVLDYPPPPPPPRVSKRVRINCTLLNSPEKLKELQERDEAKKQKKRKQSQELPEELQRPRKRLRAEALSQGDDGDVVLL